MKFTLKRTVLALAGAAAIVPMAANATNGYQLIGVGAYQMSLAGAVTANPGSAMTAVTNPAGMARIPNRADFSMEAFMPDRSTDFSGMGFGGGNDVSDAKLYGVPALGWKGPVGDSGKFFFGGGMYGTSGMGVDYPQTATVDMGGGNTVLWDGYSNIAFWQMAPALAWNVNDKLSLGVALDVDYQQVAFKQRVVDNAGLGMDMNFDLSRAASAFGYGATLGVLYDVNDMVTVGASYKTKQNFSDLKYNLAAGDIAMGGMSMPAGKYTLDLDFPQQLALGVAVRPNKALTVSADVKWINWANTMDKLSVAGPGGISVPMDPGWKNQTVFAIGVAYAVNSGLNLRAGYNYGKSPIREDHVGVNLILPAVQESHYTLGADYKLDKHWDLGFHYMYAPKNSVTASASDTAGMTGTKISLKEQSFGINLGYRF